MGHSSAERRGDALASRREAMRVGALAVGGLTLPELFASGAWGGPPARARSCILIFMWGGPSQLDTWDPKPDAPEEIRGAFGAIETRTPGIRISEHFPMLASRTDRLAIVRSMTHDDPAHLSSVHRLQTGHLAPRPKSDAIGPSPRDWPHLGAALARVIPERGPLPLSVILPWIVSHPAAPGGRAPGQHGGWLGRAYDPFRVEGDPNSGDFRVDGLELGDGLTSDRLGERHALLTRLAAMPVGDQAWEASQAQALDALVSSEARGAFRLELETEASRERYGRHTHGQCLLLARRLVESGVRLVTVNWPDDGQNFWDTHGDNFNQLKNRLMPPADRAFSALLDDLTERGLLDETLVVWVGEFGRAPRITKASSGREHWPRCYSAVLAGGGVRGGIVYGASDHWAAYPTDDPVSPEDLASTIFLALGIDPAGEVPDRLGRPMRLGAGRPVRAILA